MISLREHYKAGAKRFLQTAIVIDDQATMGPTEAMIVPATIAAPTGSVLGDEPAAAPHSGVGYMIDEHAAPSSTALNARVLTQAFLDSKMICGLYRPDAGEDMVTRASGAAEAADIIVVDWHLETGRSQPAKNIILEVLQKDVEEKGRLRLIAVYTSQVGCEAIATELLQDIDRNETLQGHFTRSNAVVSNATTRIVVLNKRSTLAANVQEMVTEEELPNRLISEFAELSAGVMPSFALSSVAAIRKGAHHILSLYTSELDGAFIAHRCGIPDPDDSMAFAVEMITSEVRNLIEVSKVAEETLGADVIDAWVQKKIDDKETFNNDSVILDGDLVKRFITGGAAVVEDSAKSQLLVPQADGAKRSKIPVSTGNLSRIFYPSAETARAGTQKLARLSTFQREPDRTRWPASWAPHLTLGSVVQSLSGDREILLCVQPRCDSVRLEAITPFPFQIISQKAEVDFNRVDKPDKEQKRKDRDKYKFNLVLRDIDGVTKSTWVNLKPRDAKMFAFDFHPEMNAVFAKRDQKTERFLFKDSDGKEFVWLGDLKAMKAQRWASELGTRVQVVGINELEWLRQAGENKVKLDWLHVT